MDIHTFRAELASAVDRYLTHHTAHASATDAPSRKRAGDARRRALAALAALAEGVRPPDGSPLSGGFRRALEDARGRLPDGARGVFDALPVDAPRDWTPGAVYRCPRCGTVGEGATDFGARLDVMPVRSDALPTLRAGWLSSGLTDRQAARVASFAPTPHPTREGYTYALAPYRQSNCYPCRADAARASRVDA